MPHDLGAAVSQAHRICDWQENLTREEMPPVWMWPFEDELKAWFDRVEADRKDRYGGGGSRDTEAPMMSNELARDRGRGE